MNILLETGFFNTRAPLFMDIVTFIVTLLPFLMAIAIYFAQKGDIKKHKFMQTFLYYFSILVVLFFEILVRYTGGFKSYMEDSSVSSNYFVVVLILHIIIAVITLIIWSYTFFKAKIKPINRHKLFGKITFLFVALTSFSGLWVYLLLFVY